MKALAVLLALCGIASAQPISGNSGLNRVVHSSAFTGNGTNASLLDLTHTCSTSQVLQWSGSAWVCSAAAGIAGSLTSGTIPVATGTSTLGNSDITDNTGTHAVTIAAAVNATGATNTFDIDSDLTKFGTSGGDGAFYISTGDLDYGYATNAALTGFINARGYQAGTTQFRSLEIADGKGAQVAFFTGATKAVEFNGAATLDSTAHIVGALTEDATQNILSGGSSNAYIYTNADEMDYYQQSNATATGYINFHGYNFGTTQFRNTVIGDGEAHSLLLVTGSTGVTTLLGQGLGVGGLYEGQAQDVADVGDSGLIRKNLSMYTDELGNSTDTDVAASSNAGWGHNNGTATCVYSVPATSTAHSPQAYLLSDGTTYSANTPGAGIVGKIVQTGAGANCDWREVQTGTNLGGGTGISDMRSKTVTLSVSLMAASGTVTGVQLGLGRYNDNDKGTTTCPSLNASTWTRCSITRTFSATSLTDNSEIRKYVIPSSAVSIYVSDEGTEVSAVPTPYQANDNYTGTGTYRFYGAVSGAGLPAGTTGGSSGSVNGDQIMGGYYNTLAVGRSKQDPLAGFAADGTEFSQYIYNINGAILGGSLSVVGIANTGQEIFGHAAAVSYTSLTNTGVLNYDTTGHNLVLAAQASATTSHVLIATSNSGNAATVIDAGPTGVTITGTTNLGSTLTVGGNSTINNNLFVNGGNINEQTGGVTKWSVDTLGHMHSTTVSPSLTSCGTSPSIVGGDAAFAVTTGTGGTTCTITFTNAYTTNAPVCTIQPASTPGTVPTCTYSTTAITCTTTIASTKYNVICIAPN
jgi:hypothetical protein